MNNIIRLLFDVTAKNVTLDHKTHKGHLKKKERFLHDLKGES